MEFSYEAHKNIKSDTYTSPSRNERNGRSSSFCTPDTECYHHSGWKVYKKRNDGNLPKVTLIQPVSKISFNSKWLHRQEGPRKKSFNSKWRVVVAERAVGLLYGALSKWAQGFLEFHEIENIYYPKINKYDPFFEEKEKESEGGISQNGQKPKSNPNVDPRQPRYCYAQEKKRAVRTTN